MTTAEALRTAIRTRQYVRLDYSGNTAYVLEPYTLFLDSSNRLTLRGYVWASDPVAYLKGIRDFLVERITSVEPLGRGYDRPQPDYFSLDWKQVRIVSDVYCPAGAAPAAGR